MYHDHVSMFHVVLAMPDRVTTQCMRSFASLKPEIIGAPEPPPVACARPVHSMTRALLLSLGAAAAHAGTVSYTASSSASQPTAFALTKRVYVPYDKGVNYAFGMGAAEQHAYDPTNKYAYTVSEQGYINVVDWNTVASAEVKTAWALDLAGGKLTDIVLCVAKKLLIVAEGAADTVGNGKVHKLQNHPHPHLLIFLFLFPGHSLKNNVDRFLLFKHCFRRTGLETSTEDVKTAEDSEDVFTKESPEDVKTAEDVKTKTAEID